LYRLHKACYSRLPEGIQVNNKISVAIAELQFALALYNADKTDKRIVGLLTDAAGLVAQAIATGQNPVGGTDN
jgi:hypothetical protein